MYHAYGQPLYKYIMRGLIRRLMPDAVLTTDLPSSGRVTLTRQEAEGRHILHMLYGAPQVRGKAVPVQGGATRVIEMIEDVPAIGPVTAGVFLPSAARARLRCVDGRRCCLAPADDGRMEVALPRPAYPQRARFRGRASTVGMRRRRIVSGAA